MKLGDFILGFVCGILVESLLIFGTAKAQELPHQPPVVITLTLPDQSMSAEFVCTQNMNYANAFTKETAK